MTALELLLADLKDAEGAYWLPDADWTEELFHRARLVIEMLVGERADIWDEGHNHCFHVEAPDPTPNPYRSAE